MDRIIGDNLEKLIRYFIPGAVFWFNFFLLENLYGKLLTLFSLGTIIIIPIITGFILTNLYFSIYWKMGLSYDYRPLIAFLISKRKLDLIKIKIANGVESSISSGRVYDVINKREAWTIITQIWFSKLRECQEIKGVEPFSKRISDILHGLGTCVLAIISSVVMVMIGYLFNGYLNKYLYVESINILFVIIEIIIIIALCYIWNLTSKSFGQIWDMTITDVMQSIKTTEKKCFFL